MTLLPHTVEGERKERKKKKEGEVEEEERGDGYNIIGDWSHGYDMEEWACGSRRQFSTHATDTRLLFNQEREREKKNIINKSITRCVDPEM